MAAGACISGATRAKICPMKLRPFVPILLLAALAAQPALAVGQSMAQAPAQHYRVFDRQGRAAAVEQIIEALAGADVLVVGETHDDAIAHLLEAELLRRAHERYGAQTSGGKGRLVALSLEMFEADVQTMLDEYTAGLISERHFLLSSRPWRNYETDYRPLVEYARGHALPVIAANAPARYVNRVSNQGPASLNALSPTARTWLPPVPYAPASETYAAKFRSFLSGETARIPSPHAPAASQTAPGGSALPGQQTAQQPMPMRTNPHAAPPAHGAHGGGSFLLDAQNLRDATMGYRVADFLKRSQGALVVHVNGKFHSESRLGVPEHLARYRPEARAVVVTILRGEGFPAFDAERHAGLGDFIILTDPNVPPSQR
jgi:uncharacterized iron-regulated protein